MRNNYTCSIRKCKNISQLRLALLLRSASLCGGIMLALKNTALLLELLQMRRQRLHQLKRRRDELVARHATAFMLFANGGNKAIRQGHKGI